MLRMVSHPHRPQSGHITCYLNRTYHVLPTVPPELILRSLSCILQCLEKAKQADLGEGSIPPCGTTLDSIWQDPGRLPNVPSQKQKVGAKVTGELVFCC